MTARFPLLRLLLGTATCVAASVPSWAQTEAVGGKAEFLRAVAHSPALSAAQRRSTAARTRVDAAGRLPDPEVEGMYSRRRIPMEDDRNMWELNVRQPLPKRGERAAQRQRAQAAVAMSDAEYAAMTGEMAAEIALALAEAEGADGRIRILNTQLGRLDAVLKSLEARLAAGVTGRIADRLTVQTRAAAMQLMIEQERLMAENALAEARGRLGLKPGEPLPSFAAPGVADILAGETAALRLAEARMAEADAMAKMARASASPMTAVGVRFERESMPMGNEDTVGIAFMSEIPWRSRRYARAEVRAAEAERAAAQADGEAWRHRIAAAVTRVERAERLAETARRLSNETRARVEAEYDALVRAAGAGGSGESTVLQAVEILEKGTDTELQIIQAETAVRSARAELWRYLPTAQLTSTNSQSP
jgi:outer membrane protein, heavy metal efflux system